MPPRLQEITRFGIVGFAATGVHLAVLTLGVERLGLPPATANGLAFLCALGVTYAGQSLWVFRGRGRHGAGQVLRFAVSLGIGMLANVGIMALCVNGLKLDYRVGFVLGLVLVPALSFVINRYWVFARVGP